MSTSLKNFAGDDISLDALKFFFIFCPNNSGTTVISQYLTAQLDGYLPPFGHNEGQMVPAVTDMMRTKPWNKEQKYDWDFIRTQWEALVCDKPFVEASPPNILRAAQIEPIFGHDSTALISICDPYQHIASCMRRYSFDAEHVAKQWLFRARAIRRVREAYPHFPFVSYEEFVANPAVVNEKLGLPVREVTVQGKRGSDIEGIASSYIRSVGFLRQSDVAAATEVLKEARGLVKYFGYKLAGPKFLDIARRKDPKEFNVALARREAWNRLQENPS